MAVGDIALLRVVGRYQSQNIVNTLHYETTVQASDDSLILDILCDEWSTELQVPWITRHVADYTLIGVQAFAVKGNTKPPGEFTITASGLVVGVNSNAYQARTITLYGDQSAARRGRVMISGGDAGMFDLDDGRVVAGEVILMQVLADALLEDLAASADTFKLVLYDKALDVKSDIVRAKARTTPAVVRSRRIRRFFIG